MRGQLPGSPAPSRGRESEKARIVFDELELLTDRKYKCPICGNGFSVKEVRAGKAQSDGMDMDLRPRFKNIDILKYRVAECPACGYADLAKTFSEVGDKAKKVLRDKRLRYEEGTPSEEEYAREYEDAYRYYKSALRCCVIRGAASSRRGFTALYAAWLLRGWREKLREDGFEVTPRDTMGIDEERKLIRFALRNLKDADLHENFPINGMDEATFQYLLAALCYTQDQNKEAADYITRALDDESLRPALRPMAMDLSDDIKGKRREMKYKEPTD